MIYNTSGPLNPTTHKHLILNREEFGKCISLVKDSDNYLAVSGPRQFGKTTLLYQIQHDLSASKYGVSYIDLENTGDYEKTKFYNVISKNIWDNFHISLAKNGGQYSLETVCDQDAFVKFLLYVSDHTPNFQKIIFLVDEVGGMPHEIAWKSFLPSLRWIFNAGRGSGKDRKLCGRLRFVFAGSTDLLFYVGHNSPINNVCERIEVKEFSNVQVLQLAKKLNIFTEAQQQEIAQTVFEWTDGHPYLTQKMLSIVDENKTVFGTGKVYQTLNRLIESYLLTGQDKNIFHVKKTLESNPEYKTIIYCISRSCRTVGPEHAAQCGEKKTL